MLCIPSHGYFLMLLCHFLGKDAGLRYAECKCQAEKCFVKALHICSGKTKHTVQKGAVLLQKLGAVYKALCQTSLKHRREAAGLHGGLSFLQRITFHRPEASKSAQYLQHSMWILASESTQKSGQSLK